MGIQKPSVDCLCTPSYSLKLQIAKGAKTAVKDMKSAIVNAKGHKTDAEEDCKGDQSGLMGHKAMHQCAKCCPKCAEQCNARMQKSM